MIVANVVLVVAVLLMIIGALQPASRLTGLPFTVLLAVIGIVIGSTAVWLYHTRLTDAFDEIAIAVLGLPISSQIFLNVFLPILLFQAALTIDVRRMAIDLAPILLLAVVAVVVTTVFAGAALRLVTPLPLVACLLVGSIVATTDPSAVVAIFREMGAPARLARLLEGESLLNDATAIAIFAVLLTVVVLGGEPDYGRGAVMLFVAFVGGGLFGAVAGRLLADLVPRLRAFRLAQVTLTMALPYVVFVVADRHLGISGVVAVVTAGLVLSAVGRSRFQPETFRFLEGVMEQSAFWASSLVFVLAAILVPRLLGGIGIGDAVVLGVLVGAALLARAVVLFGFLPILSAARMTQRVSWPYKLVILWGGLRGAVTLALALAVTENPFVPAEVQRFVAIQATGFVLFTLLIQGTTLKPLIRVLGLDRLSPVDQAFRGQVLSLALASARDRIRATSARYGFDDRLLDGILQTYGRRMSRIAEANRFNTDISDRRRLRVGLIALANQERELVTGRMRYGGLPNDVIDTLLFGVEELLDGARSDGRLGYLRAARRRLAPSPAFRLANWIHVRLGIEWPLARQLARQFQILVAMRIVIEELQLYIDQRLRGLLGDRIAGLLGRIVRRRAEVIRRNLDALRLQYPRYAVELQQGFLERLAYREELDEIRALHDSGVIGRELYASLRVELERIHRRLRERALIDLRLPSPELIKSFPLFHDLPESDAASLADAFRPRVVSPGERIVAEGSAPEGLFLIASGAVEVVVANRRHRLGRGEFFGEMALIDDRAHRGEVTAISYCHLFFLPKADFDALSERFPLWRSRLSEVAARRGAEAASPASGHAGAP